MNRLLVPMILAAAPALAAPALATPAAPPARVADIDVVDLSVGDGVDETAMAEALGELDHAVQRCFATAQARQPKLKGTLAVKYKLDARGAATGVSVTGVASLNACVSRGIQAIQFPAPAKPGLAVSAKLALSPLAVDSLDASLTGNGVLSGLIGNPTGSTVGGFGYGRSGFGPTGGSSGWGTIGAGRDGQASRPSVSLGPAEISSAPDAAMIRDAISQRLDALQRCYLTELAGDPKLAGTVILGFHVDLAGKVSAATGTGLAKVDACAAHVIEGITFATPSAEVGIDVKYPLLFRNAAEPAPDKQADRAPTPTISIGTPTAQGDLDKAIIRRYIKRNILKLQYCYEKQLLAHPRLAGTVTATFTINVEGKVTASIATGLADVDTCVADVIRDIEFPKPKTGDVIVHYPFSFRPPSH